MTMQRKQRAHFPTTKRQPKRKYLKLSQVEERFGLLLLLLQHNFEKAIQRSKTRRR
jgi:hypothetical protein